MDEAQCSWHPEKCRELLPRIQRWFLRESVGWMMDPQKHPGQRQGWAGSVHTQTSTAWGAFTCGFELQLTLGMQLPGWGCSSWSCSQGSEPQWHMGQQHMVSWAWWCTRTISNSPQHPAEPCCSCWTSVEFKISRSWRLCLECKALLEYILKLNSQLCDVWWSLLMIFLPNTLFQSIPLFPAFPSSLLTIFSSCRFLHPQTLLRLGFGGSWGLLLPGMFPQNFSPENTYIRCGHSSWTVSQQ